MVQPNITTAKELLLKAVEAQRKLRQRLVNPMGFLADSEAEEPESDRVELGGGADTDDFVSARNIIPPRR